MGLTAKTSYDTPIIQILFFKYYSTIKVTKSSEEMANSKVEVGGKNTR